MPPKSHQRALPKQGNPLLAADKVLAFDEMVKSRRLGQTNIGVKSGQVGTSNTNKADKVAMFEYAHLRVPLPKGLEGSGIFTEPAPSTYFLMRRSSDGYISATAMFKAAYPWAEVAEEHSERSFLKSLAITSTEETATNVWIPPQYALKLAEEYKIGVWMQALLDPRPVEQSSSGPTKVLPQPPTFIAQKLHSPALLAPSDHSDSTPIKSGRGRGRSNSPSKIASPKKLASPRKRASKAANAANAANASAILQAAVNNAATTAELSSTPTHETTTVVVGAKVTVDSTVETNGDLKTTHTKIKVDMPAGSKTATLPESTEEMLATAKKMVEEARKLDSNSHATKAISKRKAQDIDHEDDPATKGELKGETEGELKVDSPIGHSSKRTKTLEDALKKERVKTRALLGLTATLAIGALIPYVL